MATGVDIPLRLHVEGVQSLRGEQQQVQVYAQLLLGPRGCA